MAAKAVVIRGKLSLNLSMIIGRPYTAREMLTGGSQERNEPWFCVPMLISFPNPYLRIRLIRLDLTRFIS